MTETQSTPDENAPASVDDHLRETAGVEPGKTLGIDNTDTALSPEDNGYTPDIDDETTPAGKGSDPPLAELA